MSKHERPVYIHYADYINLVTKAWNKWADENVNSDPYWHVEDLEANLSTIIENISSVLEGLDEIGVRFNNGSVKVTYTSNNIIMTQYPPKPALDD